MTRKVKPAASRLRRAFRYDVGAAGPAFAQQVAVETPVEIRYGGQPFAVMMATRPTSKISPTASR